MICPTCQQEIRPTRHGERGPRFQPLACPHCLNAKGYQALLELQQHFVARIREDRYLLMITKPAEEARWHIALAGVSSQAWCGRTLNSRWKKKQLYHSKLEWGTVCERCAEVLEQVGQEASHESAEQATGA